MNEHLIRTHVANSQIEPLISLFSAMYDQRNRAELERDLYLTQLTKLNATTRDEPASVPVSSRQAKSKTKELEIDL